MFKCPKNLYRHVVQLGRCFDCDAPAVWEKVCNGICVMAWEVLEGYSGVVYPHPECELHGWGGEEDIPDESLPYDIGEEPHSWKDEDESIF